MKNAVEIHKLTKAYAGVTAVDDISLAVRQGKIYGLLGRNGAGKTTVMRMIAAQLFSTSGNVMVFGEAPYENRNVLSQLCFIKENQRYPDMFRVVDVMDLAPAFFPNWDREYADALIEDFRLPATQKIKKLSTGMRSAVGIIVGLASRAPLTMFDEPYLGLDAVARSLFYDRLIVDYAEHPRTIILSTHLIDEVSRVLEHVLVIDNGKLMIDETADTLRAGAFTVVGPVSKVDAFTSDKEVIDRKPFGGLVSVTALGKLDTEGRKQAGALGLEFAPVSLQQMIVQLTRGNSERKAVSV